MSRISDKLKKDLLDLEEHLNKHGVPNVTRLRSREYIMAYEVFNGKIGEKKMPLEFTINKLKVVCL